MHRSPARKQAPQLIAPTSAARGEFSSWIWSCNASSFGALETLALHLTPLLLAAQEGVHAVDAPPGVELPVPEDLEEREQEEFEQVDRAGIAFERNLFEADRQEGQRHAQRKCDKEEGRHEDNRARRRHGHQVEEVD